MRSTRLWRRVMAAVMVAVVVMRAVSVEASVSTGAPLAGAPVGEPDSAIDYGSALTPGGRCSPNDDTNTMSCEPLEPASTKNYAAFEFVIYDSSGSRCDLCGRECSLDGAAWSYCGATPVWYFGLSYGQHQFRVRGLGGDGTADPTPAVYDWVIEEPLKVEWDSAYSAPAAYVNSISSLTFNMQSSRPASSYVQFEYSTTNDYIKTFTRLSSGTTSVAVTPSFGKNLFTFRAVSIESFTGKAHVEQSANELQIAYIADNVNPAVSFVDGLADGSKIQTSSLSYVILASDIDATNGYTQSGLATLESQLTLASDGTSSPSPLHTWTTYYTYANAPTLKNVTANMTGLSGLSDGTYRLEFRVTDKCGNVATSVSRTFVVEAASLVNTPDASSLNASTTERVQTSSGTIKLASQPSDGSRIPVAYEVSNIVGGELVLETALTTALANNTLVTAAEALGGFRFTPSAGLYTGDDRGSTFGFDLKPSTSTSDSAQVVDVAAHSYITVTSTNDPPVVDVTAPYLLTPLHMHDSVSANVGTSIHELLGVNVVDEDLGNRTIPYGIAVISADGSRGTWQFSINAGSTWTDFDTSGDLTSTNALLLKADVTQDRVRFVPFTLTLAEEFTASFVFKGWDGTTGEASGATGVDVTTNSHTAVTGSISEDSVTAVVYVYGLSRSQYESTSSYLTKIAAHAHSADTKPCPPRMRQAVQLPVVQFSSSCATLPKIKSSAPLNVSPPWTIEAWVRRDAWLSKQTLFQNPTDLSAIMLEMEDASGQIGVVPPIGVTGGSFSYSAPLGEWVHLAFVMYESAHPATYSAPGANLRLYINGVYHSEITNTGFDMPHGVIGGYHLAGFSIDEVRYWSIARSSEDIYNNKERTMSGTETGLVSYVPFDAGCGDVTKDRDGGSSAEWSIVDQKWINARNFICASISSVGPSAVSRAGQATVTLTGERFTRPASGWTGSVAQHDGTNAICIFGSSDVGNATTEATVVSDTTVTCKIPEALQDVAVVQPVFCDLSIGCCTGETPIDYYVSASRPYNSNYTSYGTVAPPTYANQLLEYRDAKILSVAPFMVDWATGAMLSVSGNGFTVPVDSVFSTKPSCLFRTQLASGTWSVLQMTEAEIISDGFAKCEYTASTIPALHESRVSRFSAELYLVYYFSSGGSFSIGPTTLVMHLSSYTLQPRQDLPQTEISELGGSVVAFSATYNKPDLSGAFPDFATGRVSSQDVACAFGTVRPVLARYNDSQTFECVSPAAPRAAPTTVPLYVTLFASSTATAFIRASLPTSDGTLRYSKQPTVEAVWPSAVLSIALRTPAPLVAIGSNFPLTDTECRLNSLTFGTATVTASKVYCDVSGFGMGSPGFRVVGVGNYMLYADDNYVMVRDSDVYVDAIVSGGALGPLYGGWVLAVSGSGFLPGDGCALYASPGDSASADDPSEGHWVSSALIKCAAPKIEDATANWYSTEDGGGWVTELVAGLASRNEDGAMHVLSGSSNYTATTKHYAAISSVEYLSSDPVFLSVEGGTEVKLFARNGTAASASMACRFGTVSVLADWGWSNSSTTSVLRCISPSFGRYSADTVRLTVSQGDPGHHGEALVDDSVSMLKPVEVVRVDEHSQFIEVDDLTSIPSDQLAEYECYYVGDRDVAYPSTATSSTRVTCPNDFIARAFRSDMAFVAYALAVRGGDNLTMQSIQYLITPQLSSVSVSAAPPPYGYRPAFAQSDCTSLSLDSDHAAYSGRPETPYEMETFVLPAVTTFGGAWWHVSNSIGNTLHVNGRYFRSYQDGGAILFSFGHQGKTETAAGVFVSSALAKVEVPLLVDHKHETTLRVSINGGNSWSPERLIFRFPEIDFVDADLQTVQQTCETS